MSAVHECKNIQSLIYSFSQVRKQGQAVLCKGFREFAFSYRAMEPEIHAFLSNTEGVEHHQFKVTH